MQGNELNDTLNSVENDGAADGLYGGDGYDKCYYDGTRDSAVNCEEVGIVFW